MRKNVLVLVFAFVSGVAVGAAALVCAREASAGQYGAGQTFTITTDAAGKIIRSTVPKPVTLGNESLGLRVVGKRNGHVVGTLVAKIDGRWVDVQFAPQDSLLGR